jgi:hypothetical protein
MTHPAASSATNTGASGPGPTDPGAGASADASAGQVLLTIFLKHDQRNDLEAIQSILKAKDWWSRFPIAGTRVVSWTVAMGFGQIVVIETPPALVPLINLELERSAWGVFTTECFVSYDFLPVRERIRERVRLGGQ